MLKRVYLITLIAVVALCGVSCRREVERGVERGTERKIDRELYSGGTTGAKADAYASKIRFNMTVKRQPNGEVLLTGLVHNTGSKTVTHLKVQISLLDRNGVQVGGKTDLFAHTLPFGDNNTPILPRSRKRVRTTVRAPKDWQGGKVDITVLRIAVKG